MYLQELFSTDERLRILEHVMLREDQRVSMISRECGLSKGLVSQFMRTLQANGLVRKVGNLYSPTDNFISREVRRIINLSKVRVRRMDRRSILGLGLYGSWARGTNTIESDVDVWVKTDRYPSQEYLAAFSSQLRKMFGTEVRLLVLTSEKIGQIKTDEVFHFNLRKDSIVLWGEDIA
jgi:predicted nucleotidyltransferase